MVVGLLGLSVRSSRKSENHGQFVGTILGRKKIYNLYTKCCYY